jgi:hypothetical protein
MEALCCHCTWLPLSGGWLAWTRAHQNNALHANFSMEFCLGTLLLFDKGLQELADPLVLGPGSR